MTNDDLCRLALAAIDDPESRVVLADAVNESGWTDDRLFGDWVDERGLTWSIFYISSSFGDVKSKAPAPSASATRRRAGRRPPTQRPSIGGGNDDVRRRQGAPLTSRFGYDATMNDEAMISVHSITGHPLVPDFAIPRSGVTWEPGSYTVRVTDTARESLIAGLGDRWQERFFALSIGATTLRGCLFHSADRNRVTLHHFDRREPAP